MQSSVQSLSRVRLLVTPKSQHVRPPFSSPAPGVSQTQVHRIWDAIQPSHPLSSLPPPASNPPQHQSLFQWINSLHEVAKVLEFQLQHHSLQRNPRVGQGYTGSHAPALSLSRVWRFATPRAISLPGSFLHGISHARILEWSAISFSRGFSLSRDRTRISCIGRRIHHWVMWEAPTLDQGKTQYND